MKIEHTLIGISNFNRPGTKRAKTTAIACHYIGNPGTSAQANRNWFESLKNGKGVKASCHYIIGLQGEVLYLVPEDEISWCTNSANAYTINIEACHPDATGKFTDATYQSYVELCAELCSRWGLDPLAGGLIRHYDVTRKICPKYFVDNPNAWQIFKNDVARKMNPKKSGWYQEDGGQRFYNGDTGEPIRNDWYQDVDGNWYWFDGKGLMLTDKWYMHNGAWFRLGHDGAMVRGLQTIDGKWYCLDESGKMSVNPVLLTPDKDGALQFLGIEN